MATYGSVLKAQGIGQNDIIKRAKELFPDKEVKFRGQELGQAFKMYDYFEEHPEMNHLPRASSTAIEAPRHHLPTTSGIIRVLPALRTKPFVLLAGISGTGKSRLVKELAIASCPGRLRDEDGTTPGNYCMIEVKPNWHDSTELLGYYSNISKQYDYTKFVRFLVKAMQHPTVPFFVCLDEMNLAPVEQYFAEYLSELESRKRSASDPHKVVTGALVDKRYFETIYEVKDGEKVVINDKPTDRDWYEYLCLPKTDTGRTDTPTTGEESDTSDLRTKGLTLPDNVIVIGTVNMDDTTHQFSRKVIDRAFTIEMNGGRMQDIFGGQSQLEYQPDDKVADMGTFGARYVTADEAVAKCRRIMSDADCLAFVTGRRDDDTEVEDSLPGWLTKVNDALEGTPFQVSYRVMNELVIYLAVLLDDDGDKNTDYKELANQALNDVVLMKVLPRIEGDSELFATKVPGRTKLHQLQDALPDGTARKKLQEMIDRLESSEYTRFWP